MFVRISFPPTPLPNSPVEAFMRGWLVMYSRMDDKQGQTGAGKTSAVQCAVAAARWPLARSVANVQIGYQNCKHFSHTHAPSSRDAPISGLTAGARTQATHTHRWASTVHPG